MAYLAVDGTKFQSAEKEGLCPVCGEAMKEMDRTKEGLHFFVWFKCGIENCDGQWLQKRSVSHVEHTEKMAVNNQEKEFAYYEQLVSP